MSYRQKVICFLFHDYVSLERVEQLTTRILQIEGAIELQCCSDHLVHVAAAALLQRNEHRSLCKASSVY